MLQPGMWAALVLATGGAVSVPAGPTVRASVEGACPTTAELEHAFEGGVLHFTIDEREPGWTLLVARNEAAHTSHLSLLSENGALAFERDIQGDDCVAIAGAAAAIVQVYFMRLHLVGPPPELPQVPAPEWTLWFGLLGGGALYVDPSLAAWSGQGSVGLRYRNLGAAVGASYAAPTIQRSTLDEVERTEIALHLDGSYRFGFERLWVEPGLELSLFRSEITVLTLPDQPSTTRLDYGIGALVTAGLRLTDSLSLTAAVSGALLVRRDHYAIEPQGVVATSPGGRFFVGIGLRFELPL